MKLPKSYYLQEDVVELARDLIGKILVTKIDGKLTSGIIIETEAYNGVVDRACHAFNGRRTKRTEIMFCRGGVSYVYLCYGLHNLFNIVTNTENIPEAILVRAIIPLKGKNVILDRRNSTKIKKDLCVGPGKVTSALGIGLAHNAMDLTGKTLWLEDDNIKVDAKKILNGPRIGVDYAGEDAKLPYRFWVNEL